MSAVGGDSFRRIRFDGVDAFFTTPGYLRERIDGASVSLADVSVLVLDEAHHTAKGAPYNDILQRYFFTLPVEQRPRLIALTATPTEPSGSVAQTAKDIERCLRNTDSQLFVPSPEEERELQEVVWQPQVVNRVVSADPEAKYEELKATLSGNHRVIVFVHKRETAHSIADRLTVDGMPAVSIVGHGGAGSGDGMTTAMQTSQMAKFRADDGPKASSKRPLSPRSANLASKVLVSTALCEEGVDIGTCDTVVRYDPSLSVVAALQSRGRARQPGTGTLINFCAASADRISCTSMDNHLREACRLAAEATPSRPRQNKQRHFLVEQAPAMLDASSRVTQVSYDNVVVQEQGMHVCAINLSFDSISNFRMTGDPRNSPELARAAAAYEAAVLLLNEYDLFGADSEIVGASSGSGGSVNTDAVSRLHRWVQKAGLPTSCLRFTELTGLEPATGRYWFEMAVVMLGASGVRRRFGTGGRHSSKKEAKQAAAGVALEALVVER